MFSIDGEMHLSSKEVDLFFQNKDTKDFILLSTVYQGDLIWQNKADNFKTIFNYSKKNLLNENSTERLESVAKENDKGWLVLDAARVMLVDIPKDNFTISDIHFEFFGKYGDHYIWGWNTDSD